MEMKTKLNGLQWTNADSTNFLIAARNALYKATRDADPSTFPYIRTYSGTKLCVSQPRPEQIHIEDIAHHLSLLCRFTGAVNKFYSVAEHCVRVSYKCRPEDELEGSAARRRRSTPTTTCLVLSSAVPAWKVIGCTRNG